MNQLPITRCNRHSTTKNSSVETTAAAFPYGKTCGEHARMRTSLFLHPSIMAARWAAPRRARFRGHSEIISYEGTPLAAADSSGEVAIYAPISVQRLRYPRNANRKGKDSTPRASAHEFPGAIENKDVRTKLSQSRSPEWSVRLASEAG